MESCTVSPGNSNEAYVTTETQGLWYSTNFSATTPAFMAVTNYPFRFPSRVFFNPWDTNEVWVCSYGNGMKMGRIREPVPRFLDIRVEAGGQVQADVEAETGQNLVLRASTNLVHWWDLTSNVPPESGAVVFLDPTAANAPVRFYKAVAVP